MATSWKSQQCFDEGKYYLQFETDNKEYYKIMENVAQLCMDCEEQERNSSKNAGKKGE